MVKFENKVALNKVTRFLEITPLLVFFYCNNANVFYKRIMNSKQDITYFPRPFLENLYKEKQRLSFSNNTKNNVLSIEQTDISSLLKKKDFTVALLKNKHFEKALLYGQLKPPITLSLDSSISSFDRKELHANRTFARHAQFNSLEETHDPKNKAFSKTREENTFKKIEDLKENQFLDIAKGDHNQGTEKNLKSSFTQSSKIYSNTQDSLSSTPLRVTSSTTRVPQHLTKKEAHPLNQVENNKKISLFKGNRFAFFYKNPLPLPEAKNNYAFLKDFFVSHNLNDKIELLKQERANPNIAVLGGVYKNRIIDHNQIKRLANCTENKQIALALKNTLTRPYRFGFFSMYCYKIIYLLKALHRHQRSW